MPELKRGKANPMEGVTWKQGGEGKIGEIHKGGSNAWSVKEGSPTYKKLVRDYKIYQHQQKEAASKNIAANTKIQNVVNQANNDQSLLENMRSPTSDAGKGQTRHPVNYPETTQAPKPSAANPTITPKKVKKNIKKTD